MTRLAKLLAAALAFGSPLVAWAIARLLDYAPEDLGAFYYLLVLTPLGTGLAAALLLRAVQGRGARWAVAAVVAVLLAEGAFQAAAVHLGWMPGSDTVPESFHAERRSISELRAVLRGRNRAVAHAALRELGNRGVDGADALLAELQAERARLGIRYMDTELTHFAVSQLCEAGDPRAAAFVAEISSTPRASKRLITVPCGKR